MADRPAATGFAAGVPIAKDLFALLRDLALVAILVLLLLFPVTFDSILTNAGFEEGSFAGLKWKSGLVNSDAALRETNVVIANLKANNADLLRALEQTKAGGDARAADIERLQTEAASNTRAAELVQSTVNSTLASNAALVQKARSTGMPIDVPSTLYCYQEDKQTPGPERFYVHCLETKEKCEARRGYPRTPRSACQEVKLEGVRWSPHYPGFMNTWYDFGANPFGQPFPPPPSS